MADGMTRQKWDMMNKQQKLEYFKMYYLKFVILGILVVAAIIYTIVTMVTTRDTAISGELVNTSIIKEGYEAYLCEDFLKENGFDEKETATAQFGELRDDASSTYQSTIAIDAKMAAKDLDYFIVDKEGLKQLEDWDYLLDLSTILDEESMEMFSGKTVELSYNDESLGTKYIGAIDMSDTFFAKTYAKNKDDIYFAVAINSEKTENVVKMIDYLFK